MNRVRRMIGCDHSEAAPYTGRGVCVAVLDSGVAAHPDLRGRIAVFRDFVLDKRQYYDDNGHGTHVSGILGGNGSMSRGQYRGIAPECTFICGKVLDRNGGGSLKNLTRGLMWIAELLGRYPVRILNISIEMESEDGIDPGDWEEFRRYIRHLWDRNVMIVAAAGNKGPNPMTLSPIGECGGCVCVGCHDGSYQGNGGRLCNEYSSRGPGKDTAITSILNPLKKPDTDVGADRERCMRTVPAEVSTAYEQGAPAASARFGRRPGAELECAGGRYAPDRQTFCAGGDVILDFMIF